MPENGVIAHTNHFYGPRHILNQPHRPNGSTYLRQQRLLQLLKSKHDLTLEDLENFFSDRAGYPVSIDCDGTNMSFVVDLTHGILHVTGGNPVDHPFEDVPIHMP